MQELINPSLPEQQPALNKFPGALWKTTMRGNVALGPKALLSLPSPWPVLLLASSLTAVSYLHPMLPSPAPPQPAYPHFCPHVFHTPLALSYPGDRRKIWVDLASLSSISTPLFQVYQRLLTTVVALGSDGIGCNFWFCCLLLESLRQVT